MKKHTSGCRVDAHDQGFDLHYFGNFITISGSQTMYVRDIVDLCDIYTKIGSAITTYYDREETNETESENDTVSRKQGN